MLEDHKGEVRMVVARKQNMKCPVKGCKGAFSTIDILVTHIAQKKLSAAHRAWMIGNGISDTSRLNEQLRGEIKPILESKMQYNPATKLYEFL
jgi:hypothetical protein